MASDWFTEEGHGVFLMQWAHLATATRPELRLLHHIPNGGLRNIAVAASLRRQGTKPGIPDYHLPIARGPWHSLYIELKVPAYPLHNKKAGTTSVDQEEWLEALHAEGNCCWVCWGWEQARDRILEYLDA
jgi:hypothetical protein